jgi:hypothetical protein
MVLNRSQKAFGPYGYGAIEVKSRHCVRSSVKSGFMAALKVDMRSDLRRLLGFLIQGAHTSPSYLAEPGSAGYGSNENYTASSD